MLQEKHQKKFETKTGIVITGAWFLGRNVGTMCLHDRPIKHPTKLIYDVFLAMFVLINTVHYKSAHAFAIVILMLMKT